MVAEERKERIVKQYCYYQSPVGTLLLIGSDGVLEELHFPNTSRQVEVTDSWQCNEEYFKQALQQLAEYFAGSRQQFDLTIAPKGTVFQKSVWWELQKIPFGKTASYGEIAKRIGNSKACRVVGLANARNPLPIIVPCHRVIGKDGSLTGFGGGLEIKQQLLDLETRPSAPMVLQAVTTA